MKSVLRTLTLMALASVATVATLASVNDNTENWVLPLLASKVIGLAAAYVTVKCYSKWSKSDRLIEKYHQWCKSI